MNLIMPPNSSEAEQSVLGALILSPDAAAKVSDWLTEDAFYRRDHRLIYRAILTLREQGVPVDVVTLGEWFEGSGLSEHIGGTGYLIELASNTPGASNVVAYAEIVAEKARLREVISVAFELQSAGLSAGGDSAAIVATAQRKLAAISGGVSSTGPRSMREIGMEWFADLQRRHEQGGGPSGLITPWAKFNRMTGGLQAGQLIVMAGRPSMGKSAVAVNAQLAWIMAGKRVLFFNLEMSAVSIYNRLIGALEQVPFDWFKDPSGHDEDHWAKVAVGVKQLRDKELLIDDSAGLSASQIVSRAKREHARKPLDVIVIDHLHLMALAGKTRADIEIGQATAALKALAKELGIPVILLAQLNRGLESRTDKHPAMADLRESGNIEQDADIIVLLYRDDYYAQQEGRESNYPGTIELIVAKQRDGATGKVWCDFRASVGRVDDMAEEPELKQPKPRQSGFRSGRDRAAGD